MANIYIKDEVVERLDKLLKEYNETHAETERSGFIDYAFDCYEKTKRK